MSIQHFGIACPKCNAKFRLTDTLGAAQAFG
jgi:hypothetical protein